MKNQYDLPYLDINLDSLNKALKGKKLSLIDHTDMGEDGKWTHKTGALADLALGEVILPETYDIQPIVDYVKEHTGITITDPRAQIMLYTTIQGIVPHVDKRRFFTINFPASDSVKESETIYYTDKTLETVDESFKYTDDPKMLAVIWKWHEVKASSIDRRNMIQVSIFKDEADTMNDDLKKYFGYDQ